MDSNDPTSRKTLKKELGTLLRRAHENGAEVRGGCECRNDEGLPDWDVVITEVEKPELSN